MDESRIADPSSALRRSDRSLPTRLSRAVSVVLHPLVMPLYVILLLVAILWRMTRNSTVALVVGIVLEGGLGALYLTRSDDFAGLFPEILQNLSLFERFYTFVNGIFDWTAIVYFLTIIGLFLFLSVQSLEKRRYN